MVHGGTVTCTKMPGQAQGINHTYFLRAWVSPALSRQQIFVAIPYLFLKPVKYFHDLAGRSSETIKKGTHAFIRHEKVRGECIRPYFKHVLPVAIATYPPRSLLAIYQQM